MLTVLTVLLMGAVSQTGQEDYSIYMSGATLWHHQVSDTPGVSGVSASRPHASLAPGASGVTSVELRDDRRGAR